MLLHGRGRWFPIGEAECRLRVKPEVFWKQRHAVCLVGIEFRRKLLPPASGLMKPVVSFETSEFFHQTIWRKTPEGRGNLKYRHCLRVLLNKFRRKIFGYKNMLRIEKITY
jgi:hypothetical protein